MALTWRGPFFGGGTYRSWIEGTYTGRVFTWRKVIVICQQSRLSRFGIGYGWVYISSC